VTQAAEGLLTITALAQRFAQLLDSPFAPDGADLILAEQAALEQLILGIEPRSLDEACTLAGFITAALDLLASRDYVGCSEAIVRQLAKAQNAVWRFMVCNGARDVALG
jgi:hypothetical protein